MPTRARSMTTSMCARVDVLAVERDLARDARRLDRVVHAVQAADERRLAAAGRTDQRDDLVAADVEIDLLDRVIVGVEDVDLARLHHGLRRREVADGAIALVRPASSATACADGAPAASVATSDTSLLFLFCGEAHIVPQVRCITSSARSKRFRNRIAVGVHHEQEHAAARRSPPKCARRTRARDCRPTDKPARATPWRDSTASPARRR